MIPAGTTLSFEVSGVVRQGLMTYNAEDLHANVVNKLTPFVSVYSVVIRPTTRVVIGVLDWSYTATVVVGSKVDHGNADDVGSYVRTAFYEATKDVATVSRAAIVPTGSGAPAPPPIVQPDDGLFDFDIPGFDLSQLAQGLKDLLQGTVLIVVVGAVVLGVVLLKAK
jgi:hypothetical protein